MYCLNQKRRGEGHRVIRITKLKYVRIHLELFENAHNLRKKREELQMKKNDQSLGSFQGKYILLLSKVGKTIDKNEKHVPSKKTQKVKSDADMNVEQKMLLLNKKQSNTLITLAKRAGDHCYNTVQLLYQNCRGPSSRS
jgi:hypothetical protein